MWALQRSQLFDSLVLVERYFLWLQVVHGCSCFETSQIWEPTSLCSPHQSCKSQMIRRVPISTLQFGWTVTSLSLAQRPWSRVRESILKLVWRWMDFHFGHVQVVIKIAEWIVPFVPACCRGDCYQFVALIGKVCMFIINPHLVATLNSLASTVRPFAMLKLCRRPARRKGWTMQAVATNLCFSFHV